MADSADTSAAGSVRALAAALGLGKSRCHELTQEAWWPPRGPAGWNVAASRAAYDRHVRGRVDFNAPLAAAGSPPGPQAGRAGSHPAGPDPAAPAPSSPPARRELDARGRGLVSTLTTDDSPLELVRAAVRALAQRLGEGLTDGGVPARVAGDLKALATELRAAEAAQLELARERGLLVEREVARALLTESARRFVVALERLEARVAGHVEQWIADPTFRAGTVEDRALAVRAAVRALTRQARTEEADVGAELERAVAEALERRRTG